MKEVIQFTQQELEDLVKRELEMRKGKSASAVQFVRTHEGDVLALVSVHKKHRFRGKQAESTGQNFMQSFEAAAAETRGGSGDGDAGHSR